MSEPTRPPPSWREWFERWRSALFDGGLAVGLTRRQLRSAIRWESVLIALLGTSLGAVLAVAGAWGIVKGLESEGITSFTVPATEMLVIVGLAAAAGVLAALGPARRAARLDVLAALAAS